MDAETKKTKKSTPKRKSANKAVRPSKTSFVLGLPAELSAAAVVAKAKEAGIDLTEKYVYNVRSAQRTKGSGEAPKKKGPSPKVKPAAAAKKAAPKAPAKVGRTALENRFIDTALDLGLARAAALLDELRAKVKDILR